MKPITSSILLASSLALTAPALAADAAKDGQNKTGFRSVVGEVVDSRDLTIKGSQTKHRLLKLETPQGKRVVVNLGDATKLGQTQIAKGDRIYAVGKSARIGGKPVIFARYAGELNPVGATGMSKQ